MKKKKVAVVEFRAIEEKGCLGLDLAQLYINGEKTKQKFFDSDGEYNEMGRGKRTGYKSLSVVKFKDIPEFKTITLEPDIKLTPGVLCIFDFHKKRETVDFNIFISIRKEELYSSYLNPHKVYDILLERKLELNHCIFKNYDEHEDDSESDFKSYIKFTKTFSKIDTLGETLDELTTLIKGLLEESKKAMLIKLNKADRKK